MEREIEAERERAHSLPCGHPQVLSLPSHTGALSPFPSLGSRAETIKETNNFFCCLASPAPELGRILQPCPWDSRHGANALQPLTIKTIPLTQTPALLPHHSMAGEFGDCQAGRDPTFGQIHPSFG